MTTVDLVIARYCEDISWIDEAPESWQRVIYDKSQGGPRQGITLGNWTSADGPEFAVLWPDAVPLMNVGTETHTYMTHFIHQWDSLAEYTVCLPGDALRHVADVLEQAEAGIYQRVGYLPFGDQYVCNERGQPNVPDGFDELRQAHRIFFPDIVMPTEMHWTGFSMFLVRRDRIQRYTKEQWELAQDWCQAKVHAIAMERMHDYLFS